MTNPVQYTLAADTSRGASGSIWNDCPWGDINKPGGKNGWTFFDDFEDFGLPVTAGLSGGITQAQTVEMSNGRYKLYNTGNGTVKADSMITATPASYAGGIISMLCDSEGDQSVIGTHACPFRMGTTTGKLWFEARIATTSILTAMTHIFVGLGNNVEVQFGAAIPLANNDNIGSLVNLFGFTRLEDGLGVLNASYSDQAATYTHAKTDVGRIAANTWVKVGFTFDPTAGSKAVRYFVNGTESTTTTSATTISALTNLDVSPLGPVFAQFADSDGTANYAYLDWWRVAQLA